MFGELTCALVSYKDYAENKYEFRLEFESCDFRDPGVIITRIEMVPHAYINEGEVVMMYDGRYIGAFGISI